MANCTNHPFENADRICSVCGKAYCAKCIVVANGRNYCPRTYCRNHILAAAKSRLQVKENIDPASREKSVKFIRKSALSLIIWSLISLLISYSGCNRVEMNPKDLEMAAGLMKQFGAAGGQAGQEFTGYIEEMKVMTENMNSMSAAGDVLAALSLIAGVAMLTRKRFGKFAATIILVGSVLYTVYFSYLNYLMMKKINNLLASSELLSSMSGGFNIITILTAAFAAITVVYFSYILIRINTRPAKDCFE